MGEILQTITISKIAEGVWYISLNNTPKFIIASNKKETHYEGRRLPLGSGALLVEGNTLKQVAEKILPYIFI
jgi:hypothetical protein